LAGANKISLKELELAPLPFISWRMKRVARAEPLWMWSGEPSKQQASNSLMKTVAAPAFVFGSL
jgi:hypothetical protein